MNEVGRLELGAGIAARCLRPDGSVVLAADGPWE
jgi:hypothetical protein